MNELALITFDTIIIIGYFTLIYRYAKSEIKKEDKEA